MFEGHLETMMWKYKYKYLEELQWFYSSAITGNKEVSSKSVIFFYGGLSLISPAAYGSYSTPPSNSIIL